jgi:hypothetical protein
VDAVLWRLGIPAPLIHGSFWVLWRPFLAVDLDLARAKILCAPAIRYIGACSEGAKDHSEIETLVLREQPQGLDLALGRCAGDSRTSAG